MGIQRDVPKIFLEAKQGLEDRELWENSEGIEEIRKTARETEDVVSAALATSYQVVDS